MRIATWNHARGNATVKLPRLLPTHADVAAIQESPRESNSSCWLGTNPRQGVAVCAGEGIRLRPCLIQQTTAQFFLPVQVESELHFNLIAVWAKPSPQRPKYVSTLRRGLAAYSSFMKSAPTVVLGDFNSNSYFNSRLGTEHEDLVGWLHDEAGLISSYHAFYGEPQGGETRMTYFDRSKKGKGFHIDYCFVPAAWAKRLRKVTVGNPTEWAGYSDHVPLIVELD